MNPHMWRIALDPPGETARRWRCEYCKQVGFWEELEAKECTHVYPPCRYCGLTPECAIDCAGIMAVLSGKDVYLSTDDEKLKARVEREKRRRGQS